MSKPAIPQGTRDFSPVEVRKRQYVLNTLKNIFEHYGHRDFILCLGYKSVDIKKYFIVFLNLFVEFLNPTILTL